MIAREHLTTRVGIDVFEWPALAGSGVDAFVTTRHGGVSQGPYASLNLGLHVGDDPEAVVENRRRAAAALGLALGDLVFAEQTHGARVQVVGRGEAGSGAERADDAMAGTDALVTTDARVGLVIMVADCVPLLLADPQAGVLGCVHAGWRGTAAGIALVALEVMRGLGADPARVHALVGPSIGVGRYQVGAEVAAAISERCPASPEVVRANGADRWLVDLAGANRALLVGAGLAPERVHLATVGTDDERLFSHRGEVPCGRFALMARLAP